LFLFEKSKIRIFEHAFLKGTGIYITTKLFSFFPINYALFLKQQNPTKTGAMPLFRQISPFGPLTQAGGDIETQIHGPVLSKGITNIGNTCYLATLFQILFRVEGFVNLLDNIRKRKLKRHCH
jgi:hypothetical protein